MGLIYLSGATLIMAVAVFVIRYTSFHYPSHWTEQDADAGVD